jgi:septal ring factor EnvC (AmiA/AmiB activator)
MSTVESQLAEISTHLIYISKRLDEGNAKFQSLETRITQLEQEQTKWKGAMMAISALYAVLVLILNYMK